MTAQRKYNAYTLVEMLIVLAIFVVISSIGFSAFYGLKDSITVSEKVLTLTQDLRFAQRAALFLERDSSERWIYGIGIDFSTFAADGKYTLFKWCSQFSEFGDTRTRGDFPNFDKTFPIGPLNGSLPVNTYNSSSCALGNNVSELVKIPDSGDRVVANFIRSIYTSNNAVGDVGGSPAYVVFESVSGRAFFYDTGGSIVNYASDGTKIANPINAIVSIESDRTKRRKKINILEISGKAYVQTEKTN